MVAEVAQEVHRSHYPELQIPLGQHCLDVGVDLRFQGPVLGLRGDELHLLPQPFYHFNQFFGQIFKIIYLRSRLRRFAVAIICLSR